MKKVWTIIKTEAKRSLHLNGKSGWRVILLVSILIGIFVLMSMFSQDNLPRLLLSNEDDSREINVLMSNIMSNQLSEAVIFEERGWEEAKKMVEEGEAIGAIYIPKGAFDTLNQGDTATISFVYQDGRNFYVKTMKQYLEVLVGLLNDAQASAMVLYQEMKSNNIPYETRIDTMEKMALDYIFAFVGRQGVFDQVEESGYTRTIISLYRLANQALFISILLMSFFALQKTLADHQSGRIFRLQLHGYQGWQIFLGKGIFTTVRVALFISLARYGMMKLMPEFTSHAFLRDSLFALALSSLTQVILLGAYHLLTRKGPLGKLFLIPAIFALYDTFFRLLPAGWSLTEAGVSEVAQVFLVTGVLSLFLLIPMRRKLI